MKNAKRALCYILALLLVVGLLPGSVIFAKAEGVTYTRGATAIGTAEGYRYPGIYSVKASKEDKVDAEKKTTATLGIPDVAKQNLETGPTKNSPAIIMGAAVPFEVKTGPTEYTPIPGATLYAPYSYFRYKIIDEPNQGGQTGTHKKMSGFDGSYYIVRVDVSDIIAGAPEGSYLHVKHEGNKVLMVQMAYEESENQDQTKAVTFAHAGSKACCYSLANDAEALKDKDGGLTGTPYVDVIIASSGTGVAGADTGTTDPNVLKADFSLKFYVDQTADYNPSLVYDPASTDPNHAVNVMAKYYDDTKVSADTDVYGYTVMGSDLEIEIVHDDDKLAITDNTTFWSLRKAMNHVPFDGTNIKMICEVPVLEGLKIEGTAPDSRNVIFDVNSFDIQIANHQTTGAAGLTVKNATLTLTDSFNTTGAELAVGNNANMSIQTGGKLIITDQCQLEVEYDAASVAPSETDPQPQPVTYDCGVITIEDGGEIVNNGVISIEGTEGKPIDPAAPSVRDVKNAKLYIQPGGTLTNNGCLLSYGELYNMGTLTNSGRYDDTIVSNDPDKGTFTYHKGIQISWKDDVTQDSVTTGSLMNGRSGPEEGAVVNPDAMLSNTGDIVMVPGYIDNYATLTNAEGGNIYLVAVEEAVIPTGPRVDQPTVMEKRIRFGHPICSEFYNNSGSVFVNSGNFAAASVEIVSNGRTGKLTENTPDEINSNLAFYNMGNTVNDGKISLARVHTVTKMVNTASGTIGKCVFLNKNGASEGVFYDESKKITEVFDGYVTEEPEWNVWKYADMPILTISPVSQSVKSGEKAKWTVTAVSNSSEDVNYAIGFMQLNTGYSGLDFVVNVKPNTETAVETPVLPDMNGNITYRVFAEGYSDNYTDVIVKVTSDSVTPPTAVAPLVYNGSEQELVSAGYSYQGGIIQYRLGEDGEWAETIPKAKDAGDYDVFYKLATETEPRGNVNVTIAKAPVTVAADDICGKTGDALKALTYTVSGLIQGEELEGIQISTTADINTPGSYPITVSVNGTNPNYDVTTSSGTYLVSDTDFVVIAKDTYGVFSDETTYKGFNISLTIPEGATDYYSTAQPLTKENYKTLGSTKEVFTMPAGAGTHTVYYYVASADDTFGVAGSKQVIIAKATKAAPANITAEAETAKGTGDGFIKGLTPREMEYRKAGSAAFIVCYYEYVTLPVGTYEVRYMADENHNASPVTTVTIAEGPGLTVTFDSNGGSEVSKIENLSFGDLITKPEDPTREEYIFAGWFTMAEGGDLFGFDSTPILESLTLYAHWTEDPHIERLKALITEAEEFLATMAGKEEYASIYSMLETGINSAKSIAEKPNVTKTEVEDEISVLTQLLQSAKEAKKAVDDQNLFVDVKFGTWQYTAAKAVYDKGIMTGTGTIGDRVIFSPNKNMNRSQFVQALYSMDGKPAVTYVQKFSDVKEGDWFALAVTWASENGIAAGNADGTFGVNGQITREQLALMLYKYAQYKKYDTSIKTTTDLSQFTDKDKVHNWAYDAVRWAVERNIISGKGSAETGLRIDPTKGATRVECAAMINKFCEYYDGIQAYVIEDYEEPIALPAEETEDIPLPGDEEIIDDEIIDDEDVIDDEDKDVIDDEDKDVIDDENKDVIDDKDGSGDNEPAANEDVVDDEKTDEEVTDDVPAESDAV